MAVNRARLGSTLPVTPSIVCPPTVDLVVFSGETSGENLEGVGSLGSFYMGLSPHIETSPYP